MTQKQYIGSEEYRKMLVRDGERRFQEWHSRFLAYQQRFLTDMQQLNIAAGTSQTDNLNEAQP